MIRTASYDQLLLPYPALLSKQVLFDYQKGRGQEGPAKQLADFRGYYKWANIAYTAVYLPVALQLPLPLVWLTSEDKFDEAVRDDAKRAAYAAGEIGKLYAIEGQIRDNSAL